MRTPRDDRGESLLELLVAVVILGIVLVGVVGGLVTSILVADVHRKQSTAGAQARNYSEAIENSVAAGGYVPCATPAAYSLPAFTVPSGFAKSVLAVQHWDGTTWLASCAADVGLQRVTVQVASTDGRAAEKVVVVLRKPCGAGSSC